jgi:hypothetical protein
MVIENVPGVVFWAVGESVVSPMRLLGVSVPGSSASARVPGVRKMKLGASNI